MENPTSGLVPVRRLECGLCCWEKVNQANICSIHLYEDYFLWDAELDNGDNIDTSILILNDNEDGGLAEFGRRYPCLLPGNLCKEAARRLH